MSERISKRPSPRPAGNDTRLTATPDSSVFVNQTPAAPAVDGNGKLDRWLSQIEGQQGVAKSSQGLEEAAIPTPESRAGGHATENPVNHAQVLVPQDTPNELQTLLANLGVNHTPALVGRKGVFDEFLRGRLVSLLAMGLSIRQAAAALGLSHNAVWKEMKRNPELTEQVNAARFQAQIEPLLVILRESKRSWRAATWLIKYLGASIMKREETPDEMKHRVKEEWRERDKERESRPKESFTSVAKPPRTPALPQLPASAMKPATPEEMARWRVEADARREKVRLGREAKKAAQQAVAAAPVSAGGE